MRRRRRTFASVIVLRYASDSLNLAPVALCACARARVCVGGRGGGKDILHDTINAFSFRFLGKLQISGSDIR